MNLKYKMLRRKIKNFFIGKFNLKFKMNSEIVLENTKDEIIVIVDENDKISGSSSRKDIVSYEFKIICF
jgi:hypothetical protein